MMSRVTVVGRGAAMANADGQTNRLLPRFPSPAVSIRPRGLTQWHLAASAHSSPCFMAWGTRGNAQDCQQGLRLFASDHRLSTKDEQWASYYLQTKGKLLGLRSDGCGNVEFRTNLKYRDSIKRRCTGQSSHELSARLHSLSHFAYPTLGDWCGSSRVWVRCEVTRRTYKQGVFSLFLG